MTIEEYYKMVFPYLVGEKIKMINPDYKEVIFYGDDIAYNVNDKSELRLYLRPGYASRLECLFNFKELDDYIKFHNIVLEMNFQLIYIFSSDIEANRIFGFVKNNSVPIQE
jgi:hypothetical protein